MNLAAVSLVQVLVVMEKLNVMAAAVVAHILQQKATGWYCPGDIHVRD